VTTPAGTPNFTIKSGGPARQSRKGMTLSGADAGNYHREYPRRRTGRQCHRGDADGDRRTPVDLWSAAADVDGHVSGFVTAKLWPPAE